MKEKRSHTEDLKAIRKMMETSSRFLSLSGLSGVFAGLFAIVGAGYAWYFLLAKKASLSATYLRELSAESDIKPGLSLLITASVILLLAISVAFYLSYRKTKREGNKLWNPITRRMFINLHIPLFSGAVFIIALALSGTTHFIAPVMLIFYGLALVNAGKYTFGEVHYLGLLQIITGLAASFFPAHGLLFWVTGFGFLHILYGLIMYRKYE